MAKTIPIIKGYSVDDSWNLDNVGHLNQIGFINGIPGKKVDRYVHYQNCDHTLVEFTKSAISKAVEQFKECTNIFKNKGKPVDRLILVIDRWSSREKNIFKRDNKKGVLCEKESDRPVKIPCSEKDLEILIFTEEQARNTHSLRRS